MADARKPLRVTLYSRSARDGVMAVRARELAARSAPALAVEVVWKRSALRSALGATRKRRPDAVFVFDSNPRELLPAVLDRARGARLLLETGDVAADLLAKLGVSPLRVAYRRRVEEASWRRADRLIVRGAGMVEILRQRGVDRPVDVLPEGVDLERFKPLDGAETRRSLGFADSDLVAGVVGSIVWSPVDEIAYGWELVEALPALPKKVKGLIVGGGDALPRLRERAKQLGISGRLALTDRVPHSRVPSLLAACDAVLWTQTPDAVGEARTTCKLPEYLAAGRYVIASDVGAARSYVRSNGTRISYRGGRDAEYVTGVVKALSVLAADREITAAGLAGCELARQFDWNVIAADFVRIVEETVGR